MTDTTDRHVVITGNAATRLHDVAAALRQRRIAVTLQMRLTELPRHPVTTLLVAENLDAAMNWSQWWDQDAQTRHAFDTVLPRMARAAHGVLIGYTDTDDTAERAGIRAGMDTLIAEYQSRGAGRGIDFSMNALEVPPRHDETLLRDRLQEHASRRIVLANRVVTSYEEITRQTIAAALTTDII